MICQDGRTARIFLLEEGQVYTTGWTLTILILTLLALLRIIIIITIITFITVARYKHDPHNRSDSLFHTHSLSSLSRPDTDCILKGVITNIQFIRLQDKQFCLRTGLAAP